MRSCTGCCRDLPDSAFHPSNKRKRTYCKKCKNARVAARYRKLAATGCCYDCDKPALTGRRFCADCKERRLRRYHTVDHEKQLASSCSRRRRLKVETFEAYGGAVCACCGENNLEFLSLDHIAGDGAAHRRQLAATKHKELGKGVKLYEWCRKNGYPAGFRVLCMNCNFSLGHFGYCPHGLKVKAEAG